VYGEVPPKAVTKIDPSALLHELGLTDKIISDIPFSVAKSIPALNLHKAASVTKKLYDPAGTPLKLKLCEYDTSICPVDAE